MKGSSFKREQQGMSIDIEKATCASCTRPFLIGQYVYEVKLDSGSIVRSHGGHCQEDLSHRINRIPLKVPDWWVRKLGIVKLVEERE